MHAEISDRTELGPTGELLRELIRMWIVETS
jgi:hypothetical protein